MPEDITSSEICQPPYMLVIDPSYSPPILRPLIADVVVDVTDLCSETQLSEKIALVKMCRVDNEVYAQLQEQAYPTVIGRFGTEVRTMQEVKPQLAIIIDQQQGAAALSMDAEFDHQSRQLGFDCLQMAEVVFDYLPPDPWEL